MVRKLLLGGLLSMVLAFPALAVVDLNTATQAELEAVKGIGPSKAKAILAYRDKNGAFRSVDELEKVKGFGPASVRKLRPEFTVGGVKSGASAGAAGKP